MRFRYFQLLILWMVVSISAACESGASYSSAGYDRDVVSLAENDNFASPRDALRQAENLRRMGADDKALAVLARAYRLYPEDSGIMSAYARLALAMGEDEKAGQILPNAVAADPGDWRALSAQGVLYGRTGRLPQALETFAQARQISPEDVTLLNNLAVSHLLDGRAAEAIRLLRGALASPQVTSAHAERIKGNLALALAVTGQFEEADRLAGERLPRALHHADGQALRRLMGLAGPRLAHVETPHRVPVEAPPPFDPFAR